VLFVRRFFLSSSSSKVNKKVEAFSPKSPTEVAYPKQGAHKRWVDLQRSLFLLMNEALNSESFVREF
jgi:hypothetical protein